MQIVPFLPWYFLCDCAFSPIFYFIFMILFDLLFTFLSCFLYHIFLFHLSACSLFIFILLCIYLFIYCMHSTFLPSLLFTVRFFFYIFSPFIRFLNFYLTFFSLYMLFCHCLFYLFNNSIFLPRLFWFLTFCKQFILILLSSWRVPSVVVQSVMCSLLYYSFLTTFLNWRESCAPQLQVSSSLTYALTHLVNISFFKAAHSI